MKITPVNRNGVRITTADTDHYDPPTGVEIELSLMVDEATATEWMDMPRNTEAERTARNNFRNKNEYTFRRTVWLGDRTFL